MLSFRPHDGRPAHPVARRQRWEMAIGLFGFFTLVSFIVAVVAEVQGESAIREALVLLLFSALLGLSVLGRRRAS